MWGAAPTTTLQVTAGRGGAWRWAWVALALAPALTHLARLATTEAPWQFELFEDDAYYYLGIARNLAEGHGSTATGLVETNGYHPLWMALLVPLAAVFRDPGQLVLAVDVLQGVLWALAVREAMLIGRLVGRPAESIVAVIAYAVLGVLTGRLHFVGMESALVLPLLLAVVRRGLVSRQEGRRRVAAGERVARVGDGDGKDGPGGVGGGEGRDGPGGSATLFGRWPGAGRWPGGAAPAPYRWVPGLGVDLRLGGLLALVCLARLDTALSAIPLGLWLATRHAEAWRRVVRRALALALAPAVVLVAFMAANHLVFGSALPVSGRAKGLGAPFLNLTPVVQYLQVGRVVGHTLWLGVACMCLVPVAAYVARWPGREGHRPVASALVALAAGQVLLLAYLVVATSYPVWSWYHYLLPPMFFCAVLVLAGEVLDRGLVQARACLVVVGGFLVVQAGVAFRPEARAYPDSVYGAQFVRDELPADAVLAMGDRAGIFGFLSERPLLHLEGLTADSRYLDELAEGRVAERMVAEGVDYYVRYGPPGVQTMIDGRPCTRFLEPNQGGGPKGEVVVCDEDRVFASGRQPANGFGIWAFRPGLNGG